MFFSEIETKHQLEYSWFVPTKIISAQKYSILHGLMRKKCLSFSADPSYAFCFGMRPEQAARMFLLYVDCTGIRSKHNCNRIVEGNAFCTHPMTLSIGKVNHRMSNGFLNMHHQMKMIGHQAPGQ